MQAAEEKMQAVVALSEQLEAVEGELGALRQEYAAACEEREALLAGRAQMEKEVGG